MKLKYQFETVDMGEEIIAVPIGNNSSETSGVIKLNREGFEIFQMLVEGKDESLIVHELSEKYENDLSILKAYVHDTIKYLAENGLLDE